MTFARPHRAGEKEAIEMPSPIGPFGAIGTWKSFGTPDRRILLLSIALQLALALLFGHSYDTRIFMAAGYLVGTGQNPYVPQDLTGVFHHIHFNVMNAVGYPPPWPLVLGLLYRAVYAVVPNFLIYNLVIKIPVIAANIGLAYLAAAVLKNLGASPAVSRKAWVFLLLNPLLLYCGAAWGQIDPIVALLSLSALVLLYAQRGGSSAALLALSVSFKPTALPILPVALVYLWPRSIRQAARYAVVFLTGALLFCAVPFLILGWSPAPVLRHWNAHFTTAGAMSYMMVLRLFQDPPLTPGRWWLVGLIWVPALALGILAQKRGGDGFEDLLKSCTALVMIVFLTRARLTEPNVVLVLPMVVILTSLGELDRRALTAVWVLPLLFTLFNASPLQLLWVAFPEVMRQSLSVAARYGDITLMGRATLAIVWQVAGWWIVVSCFRRGPARLRESAVEGLAP